MTDAGRHTFAMEVPSLICPEWRVAFSGMPYKEVSTQPCDLGHICKEPKHSELMKGLGQTV